MSMASMLLKPRIGAEALRDMLKAIDLEKEQVQLKEDLFETKSELKRKKYVKRLKIS